MKLLNANENNSFDPTPKLKSSPLPILFIPFNNNDKNCIYCGDKYIETPRFSQKHCKKCLLRYINGVNDINTYLDVNMKLECSQRQLTPHNIQEIFYFEQIYYSYHFNIMFNSTCKLCGKLKYGSCNFYGDKVIEPCSDCYRISYGKIESTITKKFISTLHLPLWYNKDECIACESIMKFMSDCERVCEQCFIIFSGCRYCLTTNVIFGFTDQSQCMKCRRVSFIGITKFTTGNSELDNFLYDIASNIHNKLNFHIVNIIGNDNSMLNIIYSIGEAYRQLNNSDNLQMIPYSKITIMEKIAEGGFSIVYRATWSKTYRDLTVIVKRLKNSQNITKDFLNELKSNHHCYKLYHHIIRTYGFAKDPESKDYILVMEYASEGDLHKCLQKNFTQVSWDEQKNLQKLYILWQISDGLRTIHKANYLHRDFHSGNILFNNLTKNIEKPSLRNQEYKIGDLGLSQPANYASPNNEIYGVIPYIAPEVFNGAAFSKESDIYSFGMIMWELTTGCKPFASVEHDHILIYKIICGERPEITKDTPECFANLMKSCWHSDPKKRPSINGIRKILSNWCFKKEAKYQFIQAEEKRKTLINSKELGPEFAEKPHPKAIFTSRPLSSLISKALSISSSLSLEYYGYISKEYEFDIDNKSNDEEYVSKEFGFDIESNNEE